MKKYILLFLFTFLVTTCGAEEFRFGNGIKVSTFHQTGTSVGTTNNIDAAGEGLAVRFLASSSSPITDIALYINVNGNTTAQNYTVGIQTDAASTPTGTVLGANSSSFSPPAADGFTNLIPLGAQANITKGNYYNIVFMEDGTGSVPNGTVYTRFDNIIELDNFERSFFYNGTAWVNDDSATTPYILKHLDGTYSGYPFTDSIKTTSGFTDIFSNNKQGVSFKFGSAIQLNGAIFDLNSNNNNAGNLTVNFYNG